MHQKRVIYKSGKITAFFHIKKIEINQNSSWIQLKLLSSRSKKEII